MPSPEMLCSETAPPDCRVKPITCGRPSPEPLPTSLVVKNGSVARVEDLRRHADAGIGNRDAHIIAGATSSARAAAAGSVSLP